MKKSKMAATIDRLLEENQMMDSKATSLQTMIEKQDEMIVKFKRYI